MTLITEEHMRTVASCLSTIDGLLPDGCEHFSTINLKTPETPSIMEVQESFHALSGEHPLRKEFDWRKVESGYQKMQRYTSCNIDQDYSALPPYVAMMALSQSV